MKFTKSNSELYAPCGADADGALAKTTDLCIAAHQDDIEIMAYTPIEECYRSETRRFTGVVVADGSGSPRTGLYDKYTDEDMKSVRIKEQKHAAEIGDYAALALLGFTSAEIKSGEAAVVEDIKNIIISAKPEIIYTHNLADKHDTHVAVSLRVIKAIRELPADSRPEKLYAMEVWRGLDWLRDTDKTLFDTSARPSLAAALLGVFDSQISGGKRYDLAALARRTANATFYESHHTDNCDSLTFALDMTELINDASISPLEFIQEYIRKFSEEVTDRFSRLGE